VQVTHHAQNKTYNSFQTERHLLHSNIALHPYCDQQWQDHL